MTVNPHKFNLDQEACRGWDVAVFCVKCGHTESLETDYDFCKRNRLVTIQDSVNFLQNHAVRSKDEKCIPTISTYKNSSWYLYCKHTFSYDTNYIKLNSTKENEND